MKTIKLYTLFFLVLLLCNCDDDNDPTNNVCDKSYVLDTMLSGFSNSSSYNLLATMDLETHEYDIKINASGEICSIGYQNAPTYLGGYLMEVINTSNPSANYSGTHIFSQSNIDYQPITSVTVNSGDIIKVKRTILPGFTPLQDEIGNAIVKNGSNFSFPITIGNIEILGCDAYGGGGPVTDFAIPIIGLGFKVN